MICYKLTTKEGYSLYAKGVLNRKYTVGEVTEANTKAIKKGYGLLVFRTKKDYSLFCGDWPEFYRAVKVECEEKDRMPLPEWINTHRLCLLLILRIGRQWGGYACGEWPQGTMMFSKVKVIKEVGK